jgi:hypothetical protein
VSPVSCVTVTCDCVSHESACASASQECDRYYLCHIPRVCLLFRHFEYTLYGTSSLLPVTCVPYRKVHCVQYRMSSHFPLRTVERSQRTHCARHNIPYTWTYGHGDMEMNTEPTVRCVVYIHSFPTTSRTQEGDGYATWTMDMDLKALWTWTTWTWTHGPHRHIS